MGGDGGDQGVDAECYGGAGGQVAQGVVDDQQAPDLLAGQGGGLSAQADAGAADVDLDPVVDDLGLPAFVIERSDLPGWVGVVVEQGGQDPEPAGAGAAASVGDGQGELDQPVDGVGQAGQGGVTGSAAEGVSHAVGLAEPTPGWPA